MKLSARSDYASRAVLSLAKHHAGGGSKAMRVEQIAAEQGISAKYLVQILLDLKAVGLVQSVRGKEGGYLLTRSPPEITLGDVIRAVHGTVFDSQALGEGCPPELRRAWQKLQRTLDIAADAVTFQRLVDEGSGKVDMYYI